MKKLLKMICLTLCVMMTASLAPAALAGSGIAGSTDAAVSFVAEASAPGAYVKLYSRKGTASVHDWNVFTGSWDGYMTESVHGFYEITVSRSGGSTVYYRWAPSSTNDLSSPAHEKSRTLRIDLPSAGTYTVTVTPMDASAINRYWYLDEFDSWFDAATWEITKESKCSCYYETETLPRYDQGTVTVFCYDTEGDFFASYTETVYGSGTVYPQYMSGYEAVSGGEYVWFDPDDGTCSPDQLTFFYEFAREWDEYYGDDTWDPPKDRDDEYDDGAWNPPLDWGEETYDMGVPDLMGRRYGPDSMNLFIYWTQIQMKATGRYYTGDEWDETGKLGEHTRDEIKAFMKSRGYARHDGYVDQNVVNELASALGSRVRSVKAGGWYAHMDSVLSDPSTGEMITIVMSDKDSSSRNARGTRWVQTALTMLGYYSGGVDGYFGSMTASAVKRFQSDHGFVEREYVTLGVARAMLEACQRAGCDLDRLP